MMTRGTIFEVTRKFLQSKEPMTLFTNVSDMQDIVQLSRSLGVSITRNCNKRVQIIDSGVEDVHYLVQST